MENVRVLSAFENRRLSELKLSPKVEKRVREVWENEREVKGGSRLISVALFFLVPGIIALFVIGETNKSLAKVDNIAMLAAWVTMIIIPSLVVLFLAAMFSKQEKRFILGHVFMSIWRGTKKWMRAINRFNGFCLFLVMAYCGHVFTAIVFAVVWIANVLMNAIIRVEVQKEIERLENF
ncbi:MAG TPA: hypothetical protein DD454_04600 [Candidatus Moranbacteria bacterium]|nr:hypothetical protein [Candidatus Moranbacteria bacterium]